MVVAASYGEEGRPVIATFAEDVPNGARLKQMFIDSHAHIDGPEFDADRDEIIERAHAAGVEVILNVGTGDPHSGAYERAVALLERTGANRIAVDATAAAPG